jgi:hypothetical protein
MPIRCPCPIPEHPRYPRGTGFEQDFLYLTSAHPYGNPCTHVIRGENGLLICSACNKAGHGFYPREEN